MPARSRSRSPARRRAAPASPSVRKTAVRRTSVTEETPEYSNASLPINDPTPRFIHKPHTVLLLTVALALAITVAFVERDAEMSIKSGILAMAGGFLLFAALHFRDSFFTRPHPVVWRIVLGTSVLYTMLLTFVMYQSRANVRSWLRYLDPALGVPLEERSYAERCDLFTPDHPTSSMANFRGAVLDEFILAHFLGWFAKALFIRDMRLLWGISISFEIIELSMQHWLPNFAECWWDHIVLDILVCNGMGIFLGNRVLRFFEAKEYEWVSFWETPSVKGKVKRAVGQLGPAEWTSFKWSPTKDYRHFCGAMFLIFMVNMIDLNAFFLKDFLWLKPSHFVNVTRLVVWFFSACPAVREYYQFVVDPRQKRLGTQAWVCLANFALEIVIIVKFSEGKYLEPCPPVIFWSWTIGTIAFIAFWTHFFVKQANEQKKLK